MWIFNSNQDVTFVPGAEMKQKILNLMSKSADMLTCKSSSCQKQDFKTTTKLKIDLQWIGYIRGFEMQLTLSIPSSQCKFSQPFKKKMIEWCSEKWLFNQLLFSILYDISLVRNWKRKLKLITLGSERVKHVKWRLLANRKLPVKSSFGLKPRSLWYFDNWV